MTADGRPTRSFLGRVEHGVGRPSAVGGHFSALFCFHFHVFPLTLFYMRRRTKQSERQAGVRLSPDELRARTFERAAKLLSAKPRSIAELRERLSERCGTKSIVDEVIERLRAYGYLDDERYAFGYASNKVRQQPIGRRRLEQNLAMKKVNRAIANEVLEQVFTETPEEELIDRAIEKRLRLRGRPKNRAEAKSLFDHLLRQGFPFDLVSDKVRAVSKATLPDEE